MLLCLGWAKSNAPKRRISSCNLFAVFCEESDLDSSLYRIDWVRQLVSLFDDQEAPVHTAAWQAFDVFVKASTGAPGRYVPGFSLQKGVAPTVPIIIAGLTNGSNEQRENAAYAIGDLVERTEESAIKPFVVPFTGLLIRVATQATTYPPGVKTAILSALASMLERIPSHVKPFFPQLLPLYELVQQMLWASSCIASQELILLSQSLLLVQDPVGHYLDDLTNVNMDRYRKKTKLALSTPPVHRNQTPS
ncbi:hypothetical protein F4604DRAFT_1917352 [Suillus subluteus]|nr:hypothetical protein F4604DRAFT_1917352 [Suillus subluteus]